MEEGYIHVQADQSRGRIHVSSYSKCADSFFTKEPGDQLIEKHQSAGSLPERPAISNQDIQKTDVEEEFKKEPGDQLIEKELKEIGDSGLKPYVQYFKQKIILFRKTLPNIAILFGFKDDPTIEPPKT